MTRTETIKVNKLFKELIEQEKEDRIKHWQEIIQIVTQDYPQIFEFNFNIFFEKNCIVVNYISDTQLWIKYDFNSSLILTAMQEESLKKIGLIPKDLEKILKTLNTLLKKHEFQNYYLGESIYFQKYNINIIPKIEEILRNFNINAATVIKPQESQISINEINNTILSTTFHLGQYLYEDYIKLDKSERQNMLLFENNIKVQDLVELEKQFNQLYLSLSKEEIPYRIEFEYKKVKYE